MGAVQVLRVAVAAATLAAAWPARAQTPEAPAPAPAAGAPAAAVSGAGEAIAIVDARSGDAAAHAAERARLAAALQGAGKAPIEGARALALAGDDDTTDGALADAALAETRERFGALDCAGVRAPGQRAVQLLAGREAAGLDERERLRAAYSYLLLCADRDGARVPAQGFADRLRALGGAPAIPADVWARYPEIDAGSEYARTELVIADPPAGTGVAGAAVWLDHRRVGTAPMKLPVASGGHVLALARGAERAGLLLLVGDPGTITIDVGLTSYAAPDPGLVAQVRRWQAGAPVRAPEIATVLDGAGARFAIVVEGDGHASLWARGRAEQQPAIIAESELDRPAPLAGAIDDTLAAWRRGEDPGAPLVTEADLAVAATAKSRKKPAPWWVYVAIGGAAVAGGVTIWALDAGENRQRIELTFP